MRVIGGTELHRRPRAELVSLTRAEHHAGDDLFLVEILLAPGDDALLRKLDDCVIDHAGMNAEIAMRVEAAKDSGLYFADADLDRVAVIDQRSGVTRDCRKLGRRGAA